MTAHKVVFDLSAEDPAVWESVLGNVENVQKALGQAEIRIEVVAHGNGLGLLRPANGTMIERMKRIADTGVLFAACNNTMQRLNLSKQDLMPFAVVVDSGVAEVVRKQEAGWAYIKGGP